MGLASVSEERANGWLRRGPEPGGPGAAPNGRRMSVRWPRGDPGQDRGRAPPGRDTRPQQTDQLRGISRISNDSTTSPILMSW